MPVLYVFMYTYLLEQYLKLCILNISYIFFTTLLHLPPPGVSTLPVTPDMFLLSSLPLLQFKSPSLTNQSTLKSAIYFNFHLSGIVPFL